MHPAVTGGMRRPCPALIAAVRTEYYPSPDGDSQGRLALNIQLRKTKEGV